MIDFQQELAIAQSITSAQEHKKKYSEWSNFLKLVDKILKKISVTKNDFSKVNSLALTDKDLTKSQKKSLSDIMGLLLQEKIVYYAGFKSSVVTSSKPITDVLLGLNFDVDKRESLTFLRGTIYKLCSQILQDGQKKFPKIYSIEYYISMPKTRVISVNGIYILSKPDFNSENEKFFSYVNANPGRTITRAELESQAGISQSKRLHSILNDLGFTHEIKDLFFPSVSNTAVQFRPAVTKKVIKNDKIDSKKLKQILEQLKKI